MIIVAFNWVFRCELIVGQDHVDVNLKTDFLYQMNVYQCEKYYLQDVKF